MVALANRIRPPALVTFGTQNASHWYPHKYGIMRLGGDCLPLPSSVSIALLVVCTSEWTSMLLLNSEWVHFLK